MSRPIDSPIAHFCASSILSTKRLFLWLWWYYPYDVLDLPEHACNIVNYFTVMRKDSVGFNAHLVIHLLFLEKIWNRGSILSQR